MTTLKLIKNDGGASAPGPEVAPKLSPRALADRILTQPLASAAEAFADPRSPLWGLLAAVSGRQLFKELVPVVGTERASELLLDLTESLAGHVAVRAHFESADALGLAARVLGPRDPRQRTIEAVRVRVLGQASQAPTESAASLPGALDRIRREHHPKSGSLLDEALRWLEHEHESHARSALGLDLALGAIAEHAAGWIGIAGGALSEWAQFTNASEYRTAFNAVAETQEDDTF